MCNYLIVRRFQDVFARCAKKTLRAPSCVDGSERCHKLQLVLPETNTRQDLSDLIKTSSDHQMMMRAVRSPPVTTTSGSGIQPVWLPRRTHGMYKQLFEKAARCLGLRFRVVADMPQCAPQCSHSNSSLGCMSHVSRHCY